MKYKVKFWNPEKPGSGFIEAYSRAGAAKAAVAAYNALYEKLGHGLKAEYLGEGVVMIARDCSCGSGLPSYWRYDARGIELCRTCRKCHAARMRRYRPEVLVDPSYEADEAIEED